MPPAPPSSKSAEVFLNSGSTVNSRSNCLTRIFAKSSASVAACRAVCVASHVSRGTGSVESCCDGSHMLSCTFLGASGAIFSFVVHLVVIERF